MRIVQTIGNKSLWKRKKTLFLTSRQAPIGCYGKVFRWVENFDKFNGCAVCFNTSELEEEVLKALLVCHVPTTLIVTGRFHDTYNVQIKQALKENRLLILVLQQEESDKGYTARLRNQYIIGQVQHIACGYINPNGSIFGLLAGHGNVTHIVDKADLITEEPEPKPFRWTVAEDKRLLSMFYEDLGIHAIHKAINRPYSTVYNRIKALTMNDELLKGREFEDYVLELLDIAHNDRLTLKEWRGDKSLPGVYPESNSAPDFVFEYNGILFAVECKWRSHLPKDIEKELLPPDKTTSFRQFSSNRQMPVYSLLGIGGLPNAPDSLYFTCLNKKFSPKLLFKSAIPPNESLLEKIEILFSTAKQAIHIKKQKALFHNAYKPWSKDDDDLMSKLYKAGTAVEELMTLFQRNRGGIESRLRKLGLTR